MKPFLLLVVAATAQSSNGFAPPSSTNKPRSIVKSVPNSLDTLTSGLASIARIKYGVSVSPEGISNGPVAAKASVKKLYDIENNRECRRVRERITELDLVVENVIPACENSRARVATVPTMVVEIEGKEKTLEGSSAILAFFDNEFELESIPAEQSVDELLSYFPGILRAGRGTNVCGAASSSLNVYRPEKPLVLYSYEGNQFCRLVREVLTELDIVYELRSAGKGSLRREELASITGGSSQCPYLIDPNTDIKMPESKDIIVYLYKQYAEFTPPNELLKSVSNVVTPILAPVYKIIAPMQAGSRRENEAEYNSELADAKAKIDEEIALAPVVIYTYSLSPFCTEATALLESAGIRFKEISLGKEWLPGLIDEPMKRAALLEMTGSSSLPSIFIGGNSIGGLFSGTPGLLPLLEAGELRSMVEGAQGKESS